MKKKQTILLLLILPIVTLPFAKKSLKAEDDEKIIAYNYLYEENFEKYQNNSSWIRKAIYLDNANGTIANAENEIISGNKSLKIKPEESISTLSLKSGTVPMQNSDYSISLKCRATNITNISIIVKKDYSGNCYSEYGIDLENDSQGNPTAITYAKGNMNLELNQVTNPISTLENQIITLGFDFKVLSNLALVDIVLKSTNDASLILDNIKVLDKNNPGKELVVQYQSNFDDIVSEDVFNNTPFWCNYGKMVFVNDNLNKAVAYKANYYMANGDNVLLGGITRVELTTIPNTLYYYSYDIKLIDVDELVITTLDNQDKGQIYSEITYSSFYKDFKVTATGGIKNFKSVYDNGIYHLSYYRLTSNNGNDEHKLFATSTYGKESSVIIDNFVVAHEEK